MKSELRNHIIEEKEYYDLLKNNQQFRLQGWDSKSNKVVVGIIQGDPKEYNQGTEHLNFKYFDTWKEAYSQL